jgi:hypothetical protein
VARRYADDYAVRGFWIGVLVAVLLWFFPIPVALATYMFPTDRPFGDVMLLCAPLFILIPFASAAIGSAIRRG